MPVRIIRSLVLATLGIILIIGSAFPVLSGTISSKELEGLECNPDDNNNSVTATYLGRYSHYYNAVCEADQFDWFCIPLMGCVSWEGYITVLANAPGLAVRLYLDSGNGPQLIKEESPKPRQIEENINYELYWYIKDMVADMGLSTAPPGMYYIRITYYSGYPGSHPYRLDTNLKPAGFAAPSNTASGSAIELPPTKLYHGHLDSTNQSNWFKFTINSGQTTTGIIFSDNISYVAADAGYPGSANYEMILRDSSFNALDSVTVTGTSIQSIDWMSKQPLAPGTYYIEMARPSNVSSTSWKAYYMVFNHILAPKAGAWGTDSNNDMASAPPIADGETVNGAVYYPRDEKDVFMISSQYYFLGDFLIGPDSEYLHMGVSLQNTVGGYPGAHYIVNTGLTGEMSPLDAGTYYLSIYDRDKMYSPVAYTLTYYEHGAPMTGSMGHATQETAFIIEPGEATAYYVLGEDLVIYFQPGVQDVYYAKVDVPSSGQLAGYFEFKGSRPDYDVTIGKIVDNSTQWTLAKSPDAKGRLLIDLNFEFDAPAGSYMIQVHMKPSSPGRMKVFLENNCRIAECAPDGDSLDNAGNLKSIMKGNNYYRFGEVCQGEDNEDYYFFKADEFDAAEGPNQFLRLKGAYAGMKIYLFSTDPAGTLGIAEVTEAGGYAIIDLDGIVFPKRKYNVVVVKANIDEIQVYELELCPDLVMIRPSGWALKTERIKLPVKAGVKAKVKKKL